MKTPHEVAGEKIWTRGLWKFPGDVLKCMLEPAGHNDFPCLPHDGTTLSLFKPERVTRRFRGHKTLLYAIWQRLNRNKMQLDRNRVSRCDVSHIVTSVTCAGKTNTQTPSCQQ